VNASSVTDWTKVTSVRVSVLAISLEDNLSDNPAAYVFDGASKTASDKRLRRSFTSTIAIRNRLL
jgi:type IV pilus assembly protein PilW